MFYLDVQRAIVRRSSSLVRDSSCSDREVNWAARSSLTPVPFIYESTSTTIQRPKGAIQKEIVTTLFEAMLGCIVDSWQTVSMKKPKRVSQEEPEINEQIPKPKLGRKSKMFSRQSIFKKINPSRADVRDVQIQVEPLNVVWWSGCDQRAVIKFKNGNLYEGDISMSCMSGEGRYQWADGTVYLGQFKDNEIEGKGVIRWKDETWYEGDFLGNVRHGHGLYVDSRNQRSYMGGWCNGAKHGDGKMFYSKDTYNSYDGEWVMNVRHGFGAREYCKMGGYKGDWYFNLQEGHGLMIWPNHDFYRGQWSFGMISGKGLYIWDTILNYSMSCPTAIMYQGDWHLGNRHGYGYLNLGTGWGSYYKGEFKNNKKHGSGRLVTNNGLILKNDALFYEDNIVQVADDDNDDAYFKMYNDQYGLLYHIQQAYLNLDRQEEIRAFMIDQFITNNKYTNYQWIEQSSFKNGNLVDISDFIEHEKDALYKLTKAYEPALKDIYYEYAKICNQEEIKFTPVLIRLYLWQFYYDCEIHKKGMTLADVDTLLYDNKDWLIESPHNPFEQIYYWQFLHSLISVARKLYDKRHLPGPRPETIVAKAFKSFMDNDVFPNVNIQRGHLVNGYANCIPLHGLYELYKSIGELHTVHNFMCSIRGLVDDISMYKKANIQESPSDNIVYGNNTYVVGVNMDYVIDDFFVDKSKMEEVEAKHTNESDQTKMSSFANLSSTCLLDIFAKIFTGLHKCGIFVNVEYKLTFFEFFQAFISCALESMKLDNEERMKPDPVVKRKRVSVRSLHHK